MKNLVKTLNEASTAYYSGNPIIPDHEWDALFDELKKREEMEGHSLPDSPTQNVGRSAVDSLSKVRHEFPALSLDKTKDVDALVSLFKKGEELSKLPAEVIMWKLDGSTVQLTYEDGKLRCAATRGNGEIGSDITHNASQITGIPLSISYKGKMVVRGEAVMSYSAFHDLNENQSWKAEQYKNPRNLATATIMLLDSNEVKERKISFFAFQLVHCENMPTLFEDRLFMLKTLGFQTVSFETTSSALLKDKLFKWEQKVSEFDYPVDGLVIAINHAAWADMLPGTGHHPHKYRGYALKWADECVETVLRNIEWSTSRTGLLNPVAVFDPVQLEGTTVSRASIHNLGYIWDKDLKIGDRITIFKANKIIPQIDTNLNKTKYWDGIPTKTISLRRYAIPEVCPVCGKKTCFNITLKDNPTVTLRCDNPECAAKKVGQFVHFCERDCMNLEGWSKKTIEKFVEYGFITEYADFWHLDRYRTQILSMDGFGERSYRKLVDAAEKARTTSFVAFIHALGIPNIGKGQAKLIYNYFRNKMLDNENAFDLFTNALESGFDFTVIDGIGSVINESLSDWSKNYLDWTSDSEFGRLLDEIHIGQERKTYTIVNQISDISGQAFAITGKLNHYINRNELKSLIESLGGKVTGSVTSKTDYLINNDINSTSGKNKKAKELGIPIISEKDFMKLIQ